MMRCIYLGEQYEAYYSEKNKKVEIYSDECLKGSKKIVERDGVGKVVDKFYLKRLKKSEITVIYVENFYVDLRGNIEEYHKKYGDLKNKAYLSEAERFLERAEENQDLDDIESAARYREYYKTSDLDILKIPLYQGKTEDEYETQRHTMWYGAKELEKELIERYRGEGDGDRLEAFTYYFTRDDLLELGGVLREMIYYDVSRLNKGLFELGKIEEYIDPATLGDEHPCPASLLQQTAKKDHSYTKNKKPLLSRAKKYFYFLK